MTRICSTAENIYPHTILHMVQGEELEQIPWPACTAGASSNLFLKSLDLSLFLSATLLVFRAARDDKSNTEYYLVWHDIIKIK